MPFNETECIIQLNISTSLKNTTYLPNDCNYSRYT